MLNKVFSVLFLSCLAIPAWAMSVPSPLVDSAWLENNRKNVVILDIRKDTKSFTKKPVFKKDKKTGKKKLKKVGGHIEGAVLVNYKKIRAKRKVNGIKMVKLIPARKKFEKFIQKHGVNKDSTIVIVSKGKSHKDITMATRLYWQLKYYGHDNMAVLDGGMAQWIKEKKKLNFTKTKPAKGNWEAGKGRDEMLATSKEVHKAMEDGEQLVDNRPLNQYLGAFYKKSYVFAPGHIPGAKPFPNSLITEGKGPAKFFPVDKLKSLSKAMGIDTNAPTITYCNSGHLATGNWFVMSELMKNKNVQMYDGSMHQWTTEKRPTVSMKME